MAEATSSSAPQAGSEATAIAHLPAIGVDVWVDDAATRDLLAQAGQDRHLAKIRAAFHDGGLTEATARYTAQGDSPDLIIVHSALAPEALPEAVQSLAEAVGDAGKLIVIGMVDSIPLYRALMRLGVAEYLAPPWQPLDLIESMSDLFADPDAAPLSPATVFLGSRGGIGASILAHNTAWHIAHTLALPAAVLDANLPFATAPLNFNAPAGRGLADALATPDRIDEAVLGHIMAKPAERLAVLATDIGPDTATYPPENWLAVLDAVRRTAAHTIIDLPLAWREETRALLNAADRIILISAPDLVATRNAKNLLANIHRPDETLIVLNMSGIPRARQLPMKDIVSALEVEPHAVIPWAPQPFAEAAANGIPLAEAAPNSEPNRVLHDLAHTLIGRNLPGRGARILGRRWWPW